MHIHSENNLKNKKENMFVNILLLVGGMAVPMGDGARGWSYGLCPLGGVTRNVCMPCSKLYAIPMP